MKKNLILASTILCAAAVSAGAQQDGSARAAWFAKMGVERSGDDFVYNGPSGRTVLTAGQVRRMEDFEASLETAPDAEAVLARIDRQELASEGRSAEGSTWFASTADGSRMTDAGRRAVPGIILKASATASASAAPGGSAAPKALDLSLPSSRVNAILSASANPGFDGAAAASALPETPAPVAGESSSVLQPHSAMAPLAAKALPDAPKPAHTALEKDLFWSTWWGYHAAFAADFTTTGMVIGRGGYETDHLYTQFGNKNMTGVIGSAVALHVVASVASVALYREAAKKHGVMRYVLDAAAIGINSYGIGTHAWGAGHNVGVLNNWNTPTK